MLTDYFYSIPNSLLLFVFIIVLLCLSLIGLYIFTILVSCEFAKKFNDTNTGTYLATVATAIAIVIAFIISDEFKTFSSAQSDTIDEANVLDLLSQAVSALPDTNITEQFIVDYLCSIINVEFPAMSLGDLPPQNDALNSLQVAIYEYHPLTARDLILYEKTIDLFNQATFLRNRRLEASTTGLPVELWSVLIIGFIIIISIIWFIKGNLQYRVIMTTFVTVVYASLLFLIVALDFPFRGDFGITPDPYIFVLNKIGGKCS